MIEELVEELVFPCLCLFSLLFTTRWSFVICAGALCLSAANSIAWPGEWFGGYSYAIDAGIFSLAAVLFSHSERRNLKKWLSVILWFAAINNGLLALGETLLTSDFVLISGVIWLFDSSYNYYGQIMTALSVGIWAIGVICGLDSGLDADEFRNHDSSFGNTH